MKNKKDKTFGIIGLGRFGKALATTLGEAGYDIICLDKNPERVKQVRNLTEYAFVCENLNQETLEEAGIRNCDVAIVCVGSMIDVSILTTLHLVNLGIPQIIAKATTKDQGMILEKLGAQVVYPEHDMAVRLARKLMTKHVVDFFSINHDTQIYEVKVPKEIVGQTVMSSNLRKRYGINIIAIEHNAVTITDVDPFYEFKEGDGLVMIARNESMEKFEADYS